jgi:hypothetical protein
MASLFRSTLLHPQKNAQDAETLHSIRDTVKTRLGSMTRLIKLQAEVKQNDKRKVITLLGDVLADILKDDSTIPATDKRNMVNMAVCVLWSDPDVDFMRLGDSEKNFKCVNINRKVDFIPSLKKNTAQKLRKVASHVDLGARRALKREMSMPAMLGLPGVRADLDC